MVTFLSYLCFVMVVSIDVLKAYKSIILAIAWYYKYLIKIICSVHLPLFPFLLTFLIQERFLSSV